MKSIFVLALICFLSYSCTSSKSATPAELEALQTLVASRKFEIKSDWANPMATNALMSLQKAGLFPVGSSANSVSLLGNPNYLRIKGDSVFADLPYFGEVQSLSYSNDGSGIQFETLLEDYEVERNEKSQNYKLKFKAKGRYESFNVFLTFFPNGRSSMRISGTKRNSIEYTGEVSSLKTERE